MPFIIIKMKPEKKIKLSIEALDNFGVYPEIIKDMINDLNQLVYEKKSEQVAIKRILEICNEEYSGDEKIDDIVKYLNSLT